MTKQAQISYEHKRAMIAFLRARLGHLITLGYDLRTGDGAPKYIRIDCTKKALESYPDATPINERIDVTRDDMIRQLGIKWTGIFKSSCMLGRQTWIMKGVYFMAVHDGNESIAPNETNIVTSNGSKTI